MFAYPLRTVALAAAAMIGLSGCNGLYSGVSLGVGNGYYDPYDGYGYGYGSGYQHYGYGYTPYWGWYDDFYYPGTGYYVYDAYRRPHRWTDAQRRYWSERRQRALNSPTSRERVVIRDNWDDFRRDRATARSNRIERQVSRPIRIEQSSRPVTIERGNQAVRVERSTVRAERKEAREQRRSAREKRRVEAQADRPSRSSGRRDDTPGDE